MHNHTTHTGKSRTYRSWAMMKTRCLDSNYPSYNKYGGRGITVCTEWMNFSNFLNDMGDRPDGLTLDRIDNNLGYYKDNCRWATKREQALNRNIQSNNTTGITGVSKTLYGYRAYTTFDGKQINLGTFPTIEEATKARQEEVQRCEAQQKEKLTNELKRLQQVDGHNSDLSRCGQGDIQRDPVPSSWIIF